MSPESLLELFKVRVRVFLREPEAVFWTFGFPIVIALALGIAFRSRGPEKVHVAIEAAAADREDASAIVHELPVAMPEQGRRVESALRESADLDVEVLNAGDAREWLRTGKVALVVVPGDPPTFRYDPTRPESRAARLLVEKALDPRGPAFVANSEEVTEKGSRYIDFLVPGLIGMNIMSASMWGIGWSVVDARSKKLLKRLAATPMVRAYYLLAFILGHIVLVGALLVAVLVFAHYAFGVEVFGSWGALGFVTLLGALSFAGLGVLMCSRTDSSEVLSGMNNAVMLPMFVTSGVFFSSEHFPAVVQPVIAVLPLTAMIDALRAIMTDGAPLSSIGFEVAVLAAWGAISYGVALRIFRWT